MSKKNSKEILKLFPDLKQIEKEEDIILIKNAIKSCLVVQHLKKYDLKDF